MGSVAKLSGALNSKYFLNRNQLKFAIKSNNLIEKKLFLKSENSQRETLS